ncbi:MAG: wax ester/triacylglycerol synthase domain-containing protein, partial [Acidimicrobiales bacterium]
RAPRTSPRCRKRGDEPPGRRATPRWTTDERFDLAWHVRRMDSPAPHTPATVIELARNAAMTAFDHAHPLWEFTLVEGLDDDRSALITKVHHAITDGVGGIRLMMEMLDVEQDAEDDLEARLPPAPEPVSANEPRRVLDALAYEGRRQIGNATRAISSITHEASRVRHDPVGAGIDVLSTAGSVARMVSPAGEPLSPLMVDRSLSVRFDTLQVPLGSMKKASKLVGGRLNDAFVGGVTGGLGRYHRRMGVDVDKLRMTMPINVRSAATASVAGNQFAPARFPVPVAIDDPIARMNAVRELMEEQRREPALGLTDLMAGVLNRLPTTATTGIFGSMLRGVDFVTSNVPGPPIPVFLAGARLERQIAFGPMTGAAANITLLSYLDDLNIGVNTDPMAVTDPELLLECLADAFDEIIKLV